MKRTPDSISRARQRLGEEIAVWTAGIAAARRQLCLDGTARAEADKKIAFGEAQLKRCRKEMALLTYKSKRRFWPHSK